MAHDNHLVPKNLTVDIGDLRVDFLGTSRLLLSEQITDSPLHLHSKHEFQYILSGTLQESINADKIIRVEQDSVLLIPPNILHSNTAEPGSRLIMTLAMQQLHTGTADPLFSEYSYYCGLFGTFREPIILQDNIITYCIQQLMDLPDLPQNMHKRKSLLTMIFIHLAECVQQYSRTDTERYIFQPGTRYNQQYFLIEQYINTHYNKKTSVEEIAESLHISRRQADRIVDQIFGKTYATLILERRMSIAQTLLQKTDMACTQIAEKVGYTSYTGFYVAFKQHFGIAPDEMRKVTAEKNISRRT